MVKGRESGEKRETGMEEEGRVGVVGTPKGLIWDLARDQNRDRKGSEGESKIAQEGNHEKMK